MVVVLFPRVPGEVLPRELLVVADVAADRPPNPVRIQQQLKARAVDAEVVRDDLKRVGALLKAAR